MLSRYRFAGGRRKTFRREGEQRKYIFVDLYGVRLWTAVWIIILLNLIDAYLTGILVQSGVATEANPFMAFFLDRSVASFVSVKYVCTAVSLIFLCILKNLLLTKMVFSAIIALYVSIVAYEIAIFYELRMLP